MISKHIGSQSYVTVVARLRSAVRVEHDIGKQVHSDNNSSKKIILIYTRHFQSNEMAIRRETQRSSGNKTQPRREAQIQQV